MQVFRALTNSTARTATRGALAAILLSAAFPFSPGPANAVNFVVNSPIDDVDFNPGDGTCLTVGGVCTLRAAVQEANALAGTDSISISVVGTVSLGISGANEDAAATGDLDVTESVDIRGDNATTTTVSGNKLDRVFHVLNGAVLQLAEMTIIKGVADQGGAISCGDGELYVTNTILEKNTANTSGGAVFADTTCAVLQVGTTTIRKNKSDGEGGGIRSNSPDTSVTQCAIEKNKAASNGGAIYAGDLLSVDFSEITKNKGGGIFCADDCYVNWSAISKNQGYGGIQHFGTGTFELKLSSVTENSSVADAGGVYSTGSAVVIENTLFYKNKASLGGGGAALTGTSTLRNVTFSRNKASSAGSIQTLGSSVTVVNTIIDGSGANCDTSLTSLGYNIESDNTCGLAMAGDQPNTDPLLAKKPVNPFLPYEGTPPSLLVLPLAAGSPAIDAGNNGNCASVDQRVYRLRPRDGNGDGVAQCDIGSFELGW